jgi:hypothetical protein
MISYCVCMYVCQRMCAVSVHVSAYLGMCMLVYDMCMLSYDICMLSYDICMLSYDICMLSYDICMLSYDICMLSYDICMLSYDICMLSCVYRRNVCMRECMKAHIHSYIHEHENISSISTCIHGFA